MTMNVWITVFLPIILLNLLARLFQFLFDKEAKDKIVVNIVITVLQLSGIVIITLILAHMEFNLFVFLLIISTIIINFVQTTLDSTDGNVRVTKATSFLTTSVSSSIITLGLFYFLIL
ncbi:hypothetical protein ACFL96_14000 [Thermoproteota archaeon]